MTDEPWQRPRDDEGNFIETMSDNSDTDDDEPDAQTDDELDESIREAGGTTSSRARWWKTNDYVAGAFAGTTCLLTLGYVILPAFGVEPAEPPQQEVRAFNKTCRSILVIDDEEDVREILTAMLESSGFVVITAPDGPAALEVLRNQGEDIAAAILDMTMPVMSGDEVLAEIRHMLPDLPVLLCSGYDERQAMQMVGTGNISGFIAKPFQLNPLVNAVVRAIEQPERSPLTESS
ncbi:MAG: response regulator [Phycisphaerae bacterium]